MYLPYTQHIVYPAYISYLTYVSALRVQVKLFGVTVRSNCCCENVDESTVLE
jgi:hypothetical protein